MHLRSAINLLRIRVLPILLGALVPLLVETAAAADLSRDVDDYFALAFRRMLLKDFFMEAPGCNLGVNCEESGRTCGRLSMSEAAISAPGQLAGDNLCGPGAFYEVFRNNVGAYCSPSCSMISQPGPGPKCETPFEAPILGDLDGDGNPSCGAGCAVDIGDVAKACGVPYPFPNCDPTRSVIVHADGDCIPGTLDLVPGNGQCDLAAGAYGVIRVRNRARINFASGTTVACTLAVAKATRVTSTGPATILVPGDGWAAFGNLSDVGGACRQLKVATEFGPLRFGKHGEFHLDACSLGGTMRLGHDNNLRGRFVSGEFIVSNYNNTGGCCAGTTSTSTTTSTTNTNPSVTTTSTTSTTLPTEQVCCQDLSQEPSICGSAATTADCLEAGGVPGPAGSVCEANPEGGGRCTDAPPNPGGCCQFVDACAIGGELDGVTCSSLGGAFIEGAVCDPSGDCIVPTTTTTSSTLPTVTTIPTTSTSTLVTVTTIASTTTSSTTDTTLPSTTTTSTLPSGPVCCEDTSAAPPVCGSADSVESCLQAGGTPGPAESTCQADPASGGGRCKTGPPDNPGGCCQFDGSCALGDGLDETRCTSLGGAFVDDAICTPTGVCESVSNTTTTTVSTVTTSSSPSTTVTTSTSLTSTTGPSTTSSTATSTTVVSTSTSVTNTTVVSTSTSTSVVSTSIASTTSSSATSTSVVSTSTTTSTTVPGGGFTRTLGFYKTHPAVTQWILDQAGGITVCGVHLDNTNYDDATSALEALCISPRGDGRLQLVRQLTAAALTMAAGGATFGGFAECNALCADGGSDVAIGACIGSADAFNNSGDNLPAPFDGFESGSPEYCRIAHRTSCNILDPAACN